MVRAKDFQQQQAAPPVPTVETDVLTEAAS
jgi:hypothetical protein